MPEMVIVLLPVLVYEAPVGVPLETVPHALPFQYCQTGLCVPVPPERLDVMLVEPPLQMVPLLATAVDNVGSATTLKVGVTASTQVAPVKLLV